MNTKFNLTGKLPGILMYSFLSVGILHAATFTVTKIADTNDGVCNADCSLREAVNTANGGCKLQAILS